ncbi:MAG: hypothetical protein GWP91_14160, partial [Rhodobacterales bacterium]|nr:hypothetical protein [Rhodobacterales bacterium]
MTVAAPLASDARGHWAELPPVRAVHVAPRSWPSFLRYAGEKWDARRLVRLAVHDGTPDLIWERHTLFCDAGRRLAARHGVTRIVELNAPLSIER